MGDVPGWGGAITAVFTLCIVMLCCLVAVLYRWAVIFYRELKDLRSSLTETPRYEPRYSHHRPAPLRPVKVPSRRVTPYDRSVPAEVRAIFEKHDLDHSGDVDVMELWRALNTLGLQTDSKEAAQVLAKYDGDRWGRIDLDEFALMVQELRAFQSKELPAGWEALLDDESGRVYYHHKARGESSWEKPARAAPARLPPRIIYDEHTRMPPRITATTKTTVAVPTEVQSIFSQFDLDRSGDVDVNELRSALTALGLQTDMSEAARVLAKYDADRSGRIELDEFARLVEELRTFQARSLPVGWEALYDDESGQLSLVQSHTHQ